MSVLNVEVLSLDMTTFFRKGAIVTVTELAKAKSKRRPYRGEAIVDIRSALPFNPAPGERSKPHAFRLPRAGTYEVSVRHPDGVEVELAAVDHGANTQYSMVIFTNSLRKTETAFAFAHLASSVFDGNVRHSLVENNRSLTVVADDRYRNSPLTRLDWKSQFERRKPLRFQDIVSSRELSRSDVVSGEEFMGSRRSIMSVNYSDLYSIYRDLQGESSEGKANIPRWLSFSRPGRHDLVSMPWLWLPAIPEDHRVTRIDVNEPRFLTDSSERTRLEVHDSRWGALLAYVAVGRMREAGRVADALLKDQRRSFDESLPQLALQGKLREPLVATLGGLILVSNVEDTTRREWDRWLLHLAHWFPGIPDGAAIFGYRCLQKGLNKEAHKWLRISLERGIPFFSATFRLLSLGFGQLEDDASLRQISRGLISVDPSQPFTVMSVPE
jgi:hypothetical protein